MKTFRDLEFTPHLTGDGLQARMEFKNGYGVSVVRFKLAGGFIYGSYTNNEKEWELAVLYKGSLTYDTPITDDVMGHLNAGQVSNVMKQVQQLKDYIMEEELRKVMFEFLDDLRESGITNMFGASSYLVNKFDIDRAEARKVLVHWMNSK